MTVFNFLTLVADLRNYQVDFPILKTAIEEEYRKNKFKRSFDFEDYYKFKFQKENLDAKLKKLMIVAFLSIKM